ncbi:unnamed protein product [Rotaria sp. Silwood1]|nr:unnamed protein product [Rotaria sp. Silwood1]CAF1645254.1 unnamed protein product [Rotaria sp. Silwood1]
MFHLQCQSAKDIRKYSYYATEDEVLLMPATQFKVISTLNQGDLHIVQLEETRPPVPLIQPAPIFVSLPNNPLPLAPVPITRSLPAFSIELLQKIFIKVDRFSDLLRVSSVCKQLRVAIYNEYFLNKFFQQRYQSDRRCRKLIGYWKFDDKNDIGKDSSLINIYSTKKNLQCIESLSLIQSKQLIDIIHYLYDCRVFHRDSNHIKGFPCYFYERTFDLICALNIIMVMNVNEVVLKSLQLWKDTQRTNKHYSNLLNLIKKLDSWYPLDESSVSHVSKDQSAIFDVIKDEIEKLFDM